MKTSSAPPNLTPNLSTTSRTPFQPRLDPFQKLTELELLLVVEHLDPVDIIRLQAVSRSWRSLLDSDGVSRTALFCHFPNSPDTIAWRENAATRYRPLTVPVHKRARKDVPPEQDSVRIVFRRCVYRQHTRSCGRPTTIISHPIKLDTNIEWDGAGGYVAWLADETKVCVQKIGGEQGSLKCVDYMKILENLETSLPLLDVGASKVNVQIGDGIVCVTSNLYETQEDAYGSGRKAMVLVFDITTLDFLWHVYIEGRHRLLGEVDTAKGHLAYVRKTVGTCPGQPHAVALIVHDLRTGAITREIPLDDGIELTTGDIFFIVVSDASFSRLTVLYEALTSETYHLGDVTLRLYSISAPTAGTLLLEKVLHHSQVPYISPQYYNNFSADLYMDYPPRLNRFDIAESFITHHELDGHYFDTPAVDDDDPFTDHLRLATLADSLRAPIPALPTVPFSAWTISPSGRFTHTRFLTTPSLPCSEPSSESSPESSVESSESPTSSGDLYRDWPQWHAWHEACEPSRLNCDPPDYISRRFEVFMPLEHTSVLCVGKDHNRIGIGIVSYQPADPPTFSLWAAPRKQLRERLGQAQEAEIEGDDGAPDFVMAQSSRYAIRASEGMREVGAGVGWPEAQSGASEGSEADGETGKGEGEGEIEKPYEIQENGEVWIRGELKVCFLHHVQWGDSVIAIRTRWKEGEVAGAKMGERVVAAEEREGKMRDAVVVFDFNPLW